MACRKCSKNRCNGHLDDSCGDYREPDSFLFSKKTLPCGCVIIKKEGVADGVRFCGFHGDFLNEVEK